MIKKYAELIFQFKIIVIIAFILLFAPSLFSQTDSLPKHGTIKVSKPKDSTYIKASTNFFVYYDNPGSNLTYRDYIMLIQRYSSSHNSERVKITDTKPKSESPLAFNYSSYFQTNHFTKDIKMHPEETDVVRLLVYVTNKGKVKYLDLDSTGTSAEGTFVYSKDRREFKPDIVHIKTQNAFEELVSDNWQPAEIAALKKHPSKQKNKYKISNAFSEGVLTIIYSSDPIEK